MNEREQDEIQRLEEQIETHQESVEKERNTYWTSVVAFVGFLFGLGALGNALDDGINLMEAFFIVVGGLCLWLGLQQDRKLKEPERAIESNLDRIEEIKSQALTRQYDAGKGGRRDGD